MNAEQSARFSLRHAILYRARMHREAAEARGRAERAKALAARALEDLRKAEFEAAVQGRVHRVRAAAAAGEGDVLEDAPPTTADLDAARRRYDEALTAAADLAARETEAFGRYAAAINRAKDCAAAVLAAQAESLGGELAAAVRRATDLFDKLEALGTLATSPPPDASTVQAAMTHGLAAIAPPPPRTAPNVVLSAAAIKAREAALPLARDRFVKVSDAAQAPHRARYAALFDALLDDAAAGEE